MPQTRPNKAVVPVNGDAYNLCPDLATFADSLGVIVKVANQAERDGLTKVAGLVVARGDWPGVTEICDGTNWWKLGGPQFAEYSFSSAPVNNTQVQCGPLTLDSANSMNAGIFSSPSAGKIAVPIGSYIASIRYLSDIATTGTTGWINSDSGSITYSSFDQIDGKFKFMVPPALVHMMAAGNISFQWQSSTSSVNLSGKVRIERVA